MVAAGSLYTILMILAIVVAIVWIFLPFAIFGTKPRLDQQSELLTDIAQTLRRIEAIAAGNPLLACPSCGGRVLASVERCPGCDTAVTKEARTARANAPDAPTPPDSGGRPLTAPKTDTRH